MSERQSELRADRILNVLRETTKGNRASSKEKFEVTRGLITLNKSQKAMLMRALEVYFPDLYVDLKFTRPYVIECEGTLDSFLVNLDVEMSEPEHFDLYQNTNTEEYNFLRNLRLQHMVKKTSING